MKQYELYKKNAYGSYLVATFVHPKDLLLFVKYVPSEEKYEYYVVETDTKSERIPFGILETIKNQ